MIAARTMTARHHRNLSLLSYRLAAAFRDARALRDSRANPWRFSHIKYLLFWSYNPKVIV